MSKDSLFDEIRSAGESFISEAIQGRLLDFDAGAAVDSMFEHMEEASARWGREVADNSNMLGSMANVGVREVTPEEQRNQEIVDRMSGETILSTSSYQMLDTDPKNSTIDKISDELKAEDKDFWQTDQSKQARIDDAQARLEVIYEAEDDQFALGA